VEVIAAVTMAVTAEAVIVVVVIAVDAAGIAKS
jgi:hypothetical protein